ncbi:hypothetical protein Poli38472_013663 [Pythium oligandrum]|uniref:Tyrosinase copper-binding domain-containing protein n=1 Tax=Pythium oligandrum TaxID=41045 RepID=A0A8K1FF30_PYTOL|nr:hypothetical protein Poli38472_013663 [Pythium oligandrum]|eukprot:TMW61200.1 hypothetical protein Poli38472_013663 [Pythium oligandrum]
MGNSKLLALLVLLCATFSFQNVHAQVPAGTACTQPRIRKAWEAYTADEKTTYIEVIKLAMTKGYHQKFVELHVEYFSEMEAHRTCVFMYWHRMFLLGYENMLRSLGDKYKCVTLPVWDHLTATARRSAGTCTYMESCSPILRDFGGTRSGRSVSLKVYNITIPRSSGAYCVTGAMCGSFCGNNTGCANCIVRGTAYKTYYPAEASFTSVYKQMFTYSDWKNFATAIENGVHNTVHSALGGTMAYFQSPIDPLFYTHHAFIDALQTIYFKCQMGNDTSLTLNEKGSDQRFFTNCARRDKGGFNSSANITMRTRDFSFKNWVHVRTAPNNALYPFFKDLPATFGEYVDAKDLGPYSYSYQFSGELSNMYSNCKDATEVKAAMFMGDDEDPKPNNDEAGVDRLKTVTLGPTEADLKTRHWAIAMYESARINGFTEDGARDQMELILCVHKDECLGGVEDYTDLFRKNFGVEGHPRCFTLLKLLRQGEKIIGIPRWREISRRLLPCPSKDRSFRDSDDFEDM